MISCLKQNTEGNQMKVSVIIPIYNQEKYLNRCIDSLVNQNFDDYEIILVNDGSTDKTPLICDEYSQKYDFIKTIHKPNSGVSATRNVGIDAAQGEYVMFVDSDDFVTEDYISTMYNCQIENPDKFIVCNIYTKTEKQSLFSTCIKNSSETISFHDKSEYLFLYKTGLSGAPFNKIFLKSKIQENSLKFNPSMSLGEDVLFVTKYYEYCNGYILLSKPLYYYEILSTGAVSKYRKDKFHQLLPIFTCKIHLLTKDELAEYCDIFLYTFSEALKNTFDERNKDSFIQKIKYNNSILRSKEFIFCLENASKKNESPKYIKLLQKKNYLWIYLKERINKLVKH